MLEIADIDALVENITDVGFSWKEVDMAAAVKLPPIGSDARRRIEEKTRNWWLPQMASSEKSSAMNATSRF